ncbi:hypothetical protein THRCLA_07588 [Thraustotheca clavata]|uniref:Uncharacterized protein n=1 Tax=Thraustotheca clavata TaxID=74557 RepID=A0A1V9ZCX2_9STRA|nr:hypothetical protein THRCLA_07588 [Thraustotheca clavata]
MASRNVLTTIELVEIITSFQAGVFYDILPWIDNGQMFLKWKDEAIHYKHSRTHFPTNRKSYLNPLCLAILSGDLVVVQRIAKCRPELVAVQSFEYALGTQNQKASEYLIELNGGNFEFEYLDEYKPRTLQFILSVVREDNAELLHILREYFTKQYEHILCECFSLFSKRYLHACTEYLYDIVCDQGTLPPNFVKEAAEFGRFDLIRRLHYDNANFTTDAMDYAAEFGCLKTVIFFHENRTEGCTKRAMDRAACGNHLDIVKFLHFNRQEGCYPDTLLQIVKKRNYTEMVKFLIDHRPENFAHDTLSFAVYGRCKEIIKILLESKRFEFSQDALDVALADDLPDVVLLFAQAYPESIPRETLIQKALKLARFNVAYHLAAVGYPIELPDDMSNCVIRSESLEFFQWLVDQGIPVRQEWVDLAEYYRKPDLVKFFHQTIKHQSKSRSSLLTFFFNFKMQWTKPKESS